ncbi:hypothetical protein QOZ80_1BG0058200 [Eleusine coracana subsp. coracana]|nr:hypothetical protein QOZ80_1BG0058200 [Eleusine coracana subsp. coracana]
MASTAATADVTEEARAWWLRFNNGVAVDDEGEVSEDEEDGQCAARGDHAGTAAAIVAGGEAEAAYGDWGAMGSEEVSAKMAERGGSGKKAETKAAGPDAGAAADDGIERRSNAGLVCRAVVPEISGGNYEQLGTGLPQRKRKGIPKRIKLHVDGTEIHKDIAQSKCRCVVAMGANRIHMENENLRLQLTLKTKELEHEKNQRLKLELILKTKEIDSLQKQNEELKAENERLKKTVSFVMQFYSF